MKDHLVCHPISARPRREMPVLSEEVLAHQPGSVVFDY
jgi:hypothetical protein